jgi:hypothetical protein
MTFVLWLILWLVVIETVGSVIFFLNEWLYRRGGR